MEKSQLEDLVRKNATAIELVQAMQAILSKIQTQRGRLVAGDLEALQAIEGKLREKIQKRGKLAWRRKKKPQT